MASVLALCLTTFIAFTVADTTHFVSQNAAARAAVAARDASALLARGHHAHPHARSLTLAQGRKFRVRRSTAAQREAQAKLNAYAENQAAINTKWQAAAMESLKKGETPQTFEQFAAQDDGSADDSSDDASDESSDDNDDEQKPTSKTKPTQEKASDSKPAQDTKPKQQKSQDTKPEQHQQQQHQQQQQQAQTPKPSPTTHTETHSSSSSESTSTGQAGAGSGKHYSGDGTFYATGLGACGWTNKDSDYIVAVSQDLYNTFGLSNDSKVCGRKITAHRGSKSVTVTVSDACPGCAWGSLDFSPAAFKALGTEDEGRIPITWTFA
ncbi:barwin-like endoglucanase [Ceraceosorus bombacis]|uniref:Barwin-like endoglucanase n=1 Tax=Ceraceosorus bombacis TaxID=401625 RepID=A0A0P1BL17_9BASI|nr:barwin-like endoglucanase [Ceraceosorus bombacis]